MNTVKKSELTTLRMVQGNERLYPKVIIEGVLREWVGFGWIPLGPATEEDLKKYPRVVE